MQASLLRVASARNHRSAGHSISCSWCRWDEASGESRRTPTTSRTSGMASGMWRVWQLYTSGLPCREGGAHELRGHEEVRAAGTDAAIRNTRINQLRPHVHGQMTQALLLQHKESSVPLCSLCC